MTTITSPVITKMTSLLSPKAAHSTHEATTTRLVATRAAPRLVMLASAKGLAAAVAVSATLAINVAVASNAAAIQITLGSDDGGLVFVPQNFEVAAGEKIIFFNNAGFPHNVVFDEDEVPAGVDASKISMPEDELLNAKGDTYAVTLTEKGAYTFYCAPHQGAGMVGKVTVK